MEHRYCQLQTKRQSRLIWCYASTRSWICFKFKGLLYSKFSLWEEYCRIYSRKFSFTATPERSCKTRFSTVYAMIYCPKWKFEYGYPHSNAILQLPPKLQCCKPYNALSHPRKCDAIHDIKLFPTVYEGCSNMNASSFITFFTYMLRQNAIPFWKELFVVFKMAPNIKTHSRYFSSYRPLYKGHSCILQFF